MKGDEPTRLQRASAEDVAWLRRSTQDAADGPHWPEAAWRALEQAAAAGEKPWDEAVHASQSRSAWLLRGPDNLPYTWLAASVLGKEAELEFVFTVPDQRRQGWAQCLLIAWCEQQGIEGVEEVHLEVRAADFGAQGLYKSLGFCEVGRRRCYYRDPVDDAVLMHRFLR